MTAGASIAEPANEAQAVRAQILAEIRERVRLEDINRARDGLYGALYPAPRHGRAALECLEVDDDAGLTHHVGGFFASAKAAWAAWAALKRLQGLAGEKAGAV